MKNIAILGGCIPDGMCSRFKLEINKIIGVTRLKYIDQSEYCITSELQKEDDLNVTSFAEPWSGLSYSGCGCPLDGRNVNYKLSILYKLLNKDFSSYDTLILFLTTADLRKNTSIIGYETDDTPYTFLGALNVLKRTLKEKYNDKKIIFVLPPYFNGESYLVDFSEYLFIIKSFLDKNGYEYISFYDDFKHIITKEQFESLFPDKIHPSFDCRYIMVPHIVGKIKKMISNE
jgi:hypothetical protein